ncbi:MAG TPA: serine/threonine-protein kinase [Syntrophobacteraceae bacterium]|nr:serine/threonine-protein kinase [Syntrophobacteraceae bacterium]
MIGKTIKDRYEIVSKIGEGGMGVVYKAQDKTLHRPVAIKMLHPAHSNQMLKTRFEVEALVTASLNHRSIVTLYDFFEAEDNQFLVMELLEGKTGKELLEEEGAIPYNALIKIFHRVIEGLAYAHDHGIIHRDIKPNNIMITTSGEVKIMDFGIARATDGPQLTQVGFTVGSALYMSPEQIRNQKVDHRSDIYSLGITLFEMATGTSPFHDPDASEYNILTSHLSSELPSPRSVNPELPESLEEIIRKATEKNPEDRFQTMHEFGLALTSNAGATRVQLLVKDMPPIGKMTSAAESRSKPAKPTRSPVFSRLGPGTIFLAAILLVSLAAIGALLLGLPRERNETKQVSDHKAAVNESARERGTAATGQTAQKQAEPLSREQLSKVEPPPKPAPVGIGSFRTIGLSGGGKNLFEMKNSDALTQNDRYYLVFSANEELYIYIAQVDTSGSIFPIFPNQQFSSVNNPVNPNSEYRFPHEGYFDLDASTGKEHIYVIASKGPNQLIEDIYQQLAYADATSNKQLEEEFMTVLNKQDSANVRSIWFWHR